MNKVLENLSPTKQFFTIELRVVRQHPFKIHQIYVIRQSDMFISMFHENAFGIL